MYQFSLPKLSYLFWASLWTFFTFAVHILPKHERETLCIIKEEKETFQICRHRKWTWTLNALLVILQFSKRTKSSLFVRSLFDLYHFRFKVLSYSMGDGGQTLRVCTQKEYASYAYIKHTSLFEWGIFEFLTVIHP